jgi:hypothetical protein
MKANGVDAAVEEYGTAQLLNPVPARPTPPVRLPGVPMPASAIQIPEPNSLSEAGPWTLSYEGYDPALEARRQALPPAEKHFQIHS